MADDNPETGSTEERVYDPVIGDYRLPLPGEIISPQEESTLQRLMREAEEQYNSIAEAVADRFTPEELDIVRRVGLAWAQVRRREYLEALRSNPLNKLLKIFKEDFGNDYYRNTFVPYIREDVNRVENFVDATKKADAQMGEQPKDTRTVLKELRDRTLLSRVGVRYENLLRALRSLGIIASPTPQAFAELVEKIKSLNTDESSGKPYTTIERGSYVLRNLSSPLPELNGISLAVPFTIYSLGASDFRPSLLALDANIDAWTRILEAPNTESLLK